MTDEELLTYALLGLEQTRTSIHERITELRQAMGEGAARQINASAPVQVGRKFSSASRRKMVEAQQRRWAAVKAGTVGKTGSPKKAVNKKRSPMSAEGRERIAAAQRKRWAAVKKGK